MGTWLHRNSELKIIIVEAVRLAMACKKKSAQSVSRENTLIKHTAQLAQAVIQVSTLDRHKTNALDAVL